MTRQRKIALVGNPNAGKSALFNALTGARQKVGNYPGVTVERHSGKLVLADGRTVDLVDLPGAYSLDPSSPDERVTRDVVTGTQTGERLPVIVITGHGDVPLAVEAMKLGAVDFIEKPFDHETMLASVRAALARGHAGGRSDADRQQAETRLATLSARERQVLAGLIAGHPNKTIAYDLGISPRTVEVYRANLMTKMHASSLAELVRMALAAEGSGPGSSD